MLSLILTTKGRGEQASLCIERYYETVKDFPCELIVVAYPDEGNKKYLGKFPPFLHTHLEWSEERSTPCYNIGASLCNGNEIFIFDDDSWPDDDWLYKVYEEINKNGDGHYMIQSDGSRLGNGYWAERAVSTRQFCIDHLGGVVAIPSYKSQYDDVEKTDRAMMAGKFFYTSAYIEHRHPAYGKAQIDETYKDGYLGTYGVDTVTYNKRKAEGFPNDYPAVLK